MYIGGTTTNNMNIETQRAKKLKLHSWNNVRWLVDLAYYGELRVGCGNNDDDDNDNDNSFQSDI